MKKEILVCDYCGEKIEGVVSYVQITRWKINFKGDFHQDCAALVEKSAQLFGLEYEILETDMDSIAGIISISN